LFGRVWTFFDDEFQLACEFWRKINAQLVFPQKQHAATSEEINVKMKQNEKKKKDEQKEEAIVGERRRRRR